MKVIFLGTPDFALPSLQAINNSKHQVVAVVTQPDKPVGRSKTPQPTPVKALAMQLITKSSSESVKLIIRPDMIPGRIQGTSILKNVCTGVHPRSSAASIKFLSICLNFGKTDKIT